MTDEERVALIRQAVEDMNDGDWRELGYDLDQLLWRAFTTAQREALDAYLSNEYSNGSY